MSDFTNHGDKPIEFCGDQEGWIAVGSLTDDSPNSPCHPRAVLLGVGLGPSGKQHPGNIAAMLTIAQATDLRERLTAAMGVDRPAPAPTATPALDLDAVERAAASFAKYHTEHARFGGASREFHERAETFIGATTPALIAEVRSLRAERDEARAKLDKAKRLGLEACVLADRNDAHYGDADHIRRLAIAAELEAL